MMHSSKNLGHSRKTLHTPPGVPSWLRAWWNWI